MLDAVLLDNDVVLKMCSYAAAGRLLEVTSRATPPALLEVASFSLRRQARKSRAIPNHEVTTEQLEVLLAKVLRLEPTEEEIELAAEFEDNALRLGLELDPGESQLVAILLRRGAPLLVTGDKRALVALASVAPPEANARMACLEQAVASAIAGGLAEMRSGVCSCRSVDTALSTCFSCSSTSVNEEQVMQGLRSYIADLRSRAGRLMIPSDSLIPIASQEDGIRGE